MVLSDKVGEVFSSHSDTWNRKNQVIRKITGESERLLRLAPTFARRADLRFADVGCGTGKVSRVVRRVNDDAIIYLCDTATGMLEVARRSMPTGDNRYVSTDAHALSLQDNSVNLVAMQQLLHHLGDPQKALFEAFRVLEPGGTLLLLGVTDAYQVDVFPWKGEDIHADILGRQEADTVERLVVKSGLRLQRIYIDSFFFHFDKFDDYYSLMNNIGALERPFGYRTNVAEREKITFLREALNRSEATRHDGQITIRGEYFTAVAKREV